MQIRRMILIMTISMVALAASSFATPSTQIWIPSTDIQAFMNPHIGWDIYLGPYDNGVVSNGGITIGVLPFSKVGMEIGVDYRDINGVHQSPVYFNAKIGTPEDSLFKFMPAIAIGGYDFGTSALTNDNLVYGLIAKNIWKLGRFSIGGYKGAVLGNRTLFAVASTGSIDDYGLLVSWDRTISELSDKLWLAVDYQSGYSGYGAGSFGLSWSFAPNMSAILAYDIYNDGAALKPTVTIQFDINLK
jgi:hypothetical protein